MNICLQGLAEFRGDGEAKRQAAEYKRTRVERKILLAFRPLLADQAKWRRVAYGAAW